MMRIGKQALRRCASGQALLETALVLPLLLALVFNAVNFGYFFLVAVNLAAAPRSGVEYSIMGFATPGALVLPAATSTASLIYADMTGALASPTSATIQVCTEANIASGSGVNGTGVNQKANCETCTSTSGGAVSCGTAGTGNPIPNSDPESPFFILQRVDINYTFRPIIPGTPFGITLLPASICSSSGGTISCTFHRQVSMRAMN